VENDGPPSFGGAPDGWESERLLSFILSLGTPRRGSSVFYRFSPQPDPEGAYPCRVPRKRRLLGARVEENGIRKSMRTFDEKYPYIAA